MRKRAKKQQKEREYDYSLISGLPDEILVIILSFLTVKEAGRASVLSSRWRDLWTHISRLDFEYPEAVDRVRKSYCSSSIIKAERYKFVAWMNRILKSNKAPALTEFSVCFHFGIKHASSVRKWVRYAFSRQVERLVLNLLPDSKVHLGQHCTFPRQLLDTFDLKPLKVLSLKAVEVSGEDLSFFLGNCPILEQLVVWYSDSLVNLEVSGPCLKLKHLEIYYCRSLKYLKICNTNIVSLSVEYKQTLFLENLPSLLDVSINLISVNKILSMLSCCLLQLVALNFSINDLEEIRELNDCPELTKLKKLVLGVEAHGMRSECFSFEHLTGVVIPLIKAAPCLEEFVLDLRWKFHPKPGRYATPDTRKKVKRALRYPLQFLRVVKIIGFTGRVSEFEFIRYFVDHAVALKSVIIDPLTFFHWDPLIVAELGKSVRDLVKTFEAEVPQRIQLPRIFRGGNLAEITNPRFSVIDLDLEFE